jgi:transposase InsO family protein
VATAVLKHVGRGDSLGYHLREWAYARFYLTNQERRRGFPKWLHYYKHHRPHTALGGRVPAIVSVNNVCGNHT